MADLTSTPLSSLYGTGYPQNYLGSVIQSPDLSKSGVPQQRSIRDVRMGRDVIKTVVMAGRNRSIVNSRILAKYNAERPYDSYKLEAEGLGWRSNFTTKPLPMMIEKVAPRFIAIIDGLKYFTDSSLSNKWANNVQKTDAFRKKITEVIRNRPGFRTLLEDICFDNSLFGHTICACLDEFGWFPKQFKQDESFVADGTKADPRLSQIVVLKEVYLPHELFDYIRDREAAVDAGWKLDNMQAAINHASPIQIRDRLNVGGTLETWYQNALRELTIGASYMAGASVVVVYTLLAREVTGKVTHYRVAGPEMLEIFSREDRFESMESALAYFTFQKGNGTLHGSKGVGRDIYEMAGMLDRIRNEIVDRLIMSGKTIFQGDVKRIHTFRMHVIGSSVVVPTGWNMLETKIDGNVEGFLKLDAYLNSLVDQLIGSTSPPQQEGEAFRSPAAWNLLAQRQEEGQDSRVTRFVVQFTQLIELMQKRICNPDVSDKDAKDAQKELLEIMTREELDELANSPVAGTVKDLTPFERQAIVALAQEKKGNPLYNQRQLEVESVTAALGTDFVDRILLPDEDPTVKAEQSRMQNLEIVLLSHGQAVEVSPRDNHLIHLGILMPAAEQVANQLNAGQFDTGVLEAMASHINEHYNQALMQGTPKDKLADVAEFVKKVGPVIAHLKGLDQQAAQIHQTIPGMPPAPPFSQPQGGIPPQNPPPP